MAGFKKFDPYARLRELEADTRAAAANNQIPPKNEICSGRSGVATGSQENENQNAGSVAVVAGAERAKLLTFPSSQNQNSLSASCYTATPLQNASRTLLPPTFEAAFAALERRCPDYVKEERWLVAVMSGVRFLEGLGASAAALGWTAEELFGLHTPPANPHPSYDRLARYDCTGLIWLLSGNPVVALTSDTAAIQNGSGSITTYRKLNKPALGPLGDSLDDFI
jgi:hypothetical protein